MALIRRREGSGWAAGPLGPRAGRFLAVFILMAAAIATIGWWAYSTESDYLRERENQELQAIANFKAEQIQDWLAERRLDALALAGTTYFREDLKHWLEDRESTSGKRLRARLESMGINDQYASIELLDRQGRPSLAIGTLGHRDPALPAALLPDIGRSPGLHLVDLFQDGDHIDFCYVLSVRGDTDDGVLGYLRLCMNPRRHLFPLIESWPTASETAETLLVRQDGDEALFLNDLRHRHGTALSYHLPLDRGDLPAAQAVRGREGLFAGIDYRGVPVLSYLRPIAGTPWRMVTKVDQAEVFRNVGWVAWVSVAGVTAAIVASAIVLWVFWSRQQLLASLAAAQALRRRNEELEAFMAAVPAPVLIAEDKECRRIVGNGAANEMFGVEAGTNISVSAFEGDAAPLYQIHGPDGRRLGPKELPMQRAAAAGRPEMRQECHLEFADGRTLWLLGNAVPLFDEEGGVRGCVASYTDITALKTTEQELRRSQAALVQAGQMARLGAWSVDLAQGADLRSSPVIWSDETFRLLGLSPGAVAPSARLFVSLLHPEDRLRSFEEWTVAMAERRAVDREYRIIRPDGGERTIHLRGEFVFDDQGRARHCYGAIQDITERKRLELAQAAYKMQLEDQVAARTAELTAVNRELQAFTYAASHDLKSPLRTIRNFAGLLEKNYAARLEEEGMLFVGYIRSSAERMNQLIDDLLSHARLDQQALDIRPVELAAAVRAALLERQEEVRERGAEVRVDLPAGRVWAESHGLIQVLRNLLENALKYSARACPPVIEIGGHIREGGYRLWIRDNGIGFDMADHDRIFEIFRRLHTYDEFPGSGIGLALVKKAMDRIGGKVWAESSPGKGAVFYLELPVCRQEAVRPSPQTC
ncbi:MAG TPA: ATP-binding protein [Rhodocyclaceae bacterium]|nr:ATP-binding protein [Rhodocyclaceae bacterium]